MQANLLELSKQGNVEAIAALINKSLRVRGVTAKVILKGTCLKVMLEASIVPNQKLLAPCVLKDVTAFNSDAIETLQVLGRQAGKTVVAWTQDFTLRVPETSLPVPPIEANGEAPPDVALLEQLKNRELAKQGDLAAIATLLNQAINDENIHITVSAEDTLLRVVVETSQFLDGQSFAKRIYQELLNLELPQFETAEVHKQKGENAQAFLLKSFTLAKAETAEASPETDTPQAIETPPAKGKAPSMFGLFQKRDKK
jgi:hypothetical protein